jgi:hypothetical protein
MVWIPPSLIGAHFLCLIAVVSGTSSHDTLHLESSISVENYQRNILQSQDGTFTCGFYNIYTNTFTFSIWYSNSAEKTIVWSANRDLFMLGDRHLHYKKEGVWFSQIMMARWFGVLMVI